MKNDKRLMMKDDDLKLLRVLLTDIWTNGQMDEQMDGRMNRNL